MSEQANDGGAHAFGARLLNYADNAALPVDVHDFSDAINRYLLVDKTMFIADILDSEAPVALCCRPKGFGKSMNLSMLKCYLERPDHRLLDRSPFICTQIWQAGGGRYPAIGNRGNRCGGLIIAHQRYYHRSQANFCSYPSCYSRKRTQYQYRTLIAHDKIFHGDFCRVFHSSFTFSSF